MFRSPTGARASPRIPKNQIPDGPIQDFTHIIETTAPEEWQRRTTAFMKLVASIPVGSDYTARESWYNSPATLRHLALPLSDLLKDPRSSVVRLACESTDELFAKCQGDARYLLKDIMPTVLQVHASTVHIIRNYVQATIVDALTVVPCKMAMPVWLDRLKNDKSRTVREACALYLSTAVAEWTEEGYLTREIYQQVGAALIKALKDASPAVRQNAKKGLEHLYALQSDLFDEIVASDRTLTRDFRIQKLLNRIRAGEAVGDDNMSVASRSSRVSTASAPVRGFRTGTNNNNRGLGGGVGGGIGSGRRFLGLPARRVVGGRPSNGSSSGSPTNVRDGIPSTIGVASSIPSPIDSKGQRTTTSTNGGGSALGGLGPPRRVAATNSSTNGIETETQRLHSPVNDMTPEKEGLQNSFDSAETDASELKPITNTQQLKEVVKSMGPSRRKSSLLHDRLFHSSSNGGLATVRDDSERSLTESSSINMMDVAYLPEEEIATHPNLPEHTKIAHQLLEAHKLHVDQVMEVLKVEMDALKDFELILLEEGPRRPSEEEVLEYFESLGLCLEQRTKAGMILQKKMDRISKGK